MFSRDKDAQERREERLGRLQAYLDKADRDFRMIRDGTAPVNIGERRSGETDGDWQLRSARDRLARDGDAQALIALAKSLGNLQRWEEAEQALRTALEIEPSDIEAFDLLTNLLFERGHPEEALECAETWVRARPDTASAWATAAKMRLFVRDDVSEALRYIRRGFRHVPRAFQLFHAHALVSERLGRVMDAKRSIAKACKVKRVHHDPVLEADYIRIMASGNGNLRSNTEEPPERVQPSENREQESSEEPLRQNVVLFERRKRS